MSNQQSELDRLMKILGDARKNSPMNSFALWQLGEFDQAVGYYGKVGRA